MYGNYVNSNGAKDACGQDIDCYAIQAETCNIFSGYKLCHKREVSINNGDSRYGHPCIYQKGNIHGKDLNSRSYYKYLVYVWKGIFLLQKKSFFLEFCKSNQDCHRNDICVNQKCVGKISTNVYLVIFCILKYLFTKCLQQVIQFFLAI